MIKKMLLISTVIMLTACDIYYKEVDAVRHSEHFKNEDRSKTLGGVDSNNDGVRDDVENYIKSKYKDYPEYTDVFLKIAKTTRDEMISDSTDIEFYREKSLIKSGNINCLFNLDRKYGTKIGSVGVMNVIGIHSNTRIRDEKTRKMSEMLSGMVFPIVDCEVKYE